MLGVNAGRHADATASGPSELTLDDRQTPNHRLYYLLVGGAASAVPSAELFDITPYSTVTLFARLRGWSASFPMKTAVW